MTPPPVTNSARAESFLEDAGLDAIVGSLPANVYYLSGYRCWIESLMQEWMIRPGGSTRRAQHSFAVLLRGGGRCLIVSAVFAPDALESWADDVRVWGELDYDDLGETTQLESAVAAIHLAQKSRAGLDAVGVLAATLQDVGLAEGRVGIDFGGLYEPDIEWLRQALPRADIRDCSNLIRLIRMVKSHRELELLTLASVINERSGVETALTARPGKSVAELRDQYRIVAAVAGADFDHFSPAIGGIGLSSQTRHILREDDVFSLDFGCMLDGYYSDAGFTVALGDVSKTINARYVALRDAIVEVGLGAMRPGALASGVHNVMSDYLDGHGVRACFPHGHGLGLELRDYPVLVPDTGLRIRDDCIDIPADLSLEPGMVINLEVSLFRPGIATLEVEITTLVTESGARPLIEQYRSSPIRRGDRRLPFRPVGRPPVVSAADPVVSAADPDLQRRTHD